VYTLRVNQQLTVCFEGSCNELAAEAVATKEQCLRVTGVNIPFGQLEGEGQQQPLHQTQSTTAVVSTKHNRSQYTSKAKHQLETHPSYLTTIELEDGSRHFLQVVAVDEPVQCRRDSKGGFREERHQLLQPSTTAVSNTLTALRKSDTPPSTTTYVIILCHASSLALAAFSSGHRAESYLRLLGVQLLGGRGDGASTWTASTCHAHVLQGERSE
jgi:hypothetical protein